MKFERWLTGFDRTTQDDRKDFEMRFLKVGAALIAAGICMWLLAIAGEFATAPSPSEYGVAALKLQDTASDLVERQWDNPESKPTAADRADYEKLIAEVSKVAPSSLHREADIADKDASEWMAESVKRDLGYMQFYYWLTPRIGDTASRVVATVVLGPGAAAANYHYNRAMERAHSLYLPTHLLADLRFHYAMALILAGDKPAAVKQLIDVLKYTPDYGATELTYEIGGRADAQDDPIFCELFAHVGGSVERLRKDYTGDKQEKLRPFIAHKIITAYPER
jgi:hypothetical protein